jgi:acetyltransferase-like isoleucine patch superfamily enzyme/dTDP-4-dehydrorhamnose 3,5-epimerase-like enzyme
MNTVFVHPQAICNTQNIGSGTRIEAFSHVLAGATIGNNCLISGGVYIEDDVVIGNSITIKNGTQLWNGLRIEDDVVVGPNVTFTNEMFPRPEADQHAILHTRICKGASIGANATLLPGIVIGQNAIVGAGAVVTQSVPPYAIVIGNPASIVGYVNSTKEQDEQPSTNGTEIVPTSVKGVMLCQFPKIRDLRGGLSVGEFERDIPFTPKRYFLVFDVPNRKVRGEHAHRHCKQFLICVRGALSVVADDGIARKEFLLDSPAKGLYLPPMIWGIQYKASPDAVLLVFASDYYDKADYIRDYDEFLRELFTRQLSIDF